MNTIQLVRRCRPGGPGQSAGPCRCARSGSKGFAPSDDKPRLMPKTLRGRLDNESEAGEAAPRSDPSVLARFSEGCGESPRWDLNPRPAHYECAALPLSYPGAGAVEFAVKYSDQDLSLLCGPMLDGSERLVRRCHAPGTATGRRWGGPRWAAERGLGGQRNGERWRATRRSYPVGLAPAPGLERHRVPQDLVAE